MDLGILPNIPMRCAIQISLQDTLSRPEREQLINRPSYWTSAFTSFTLRPRLRGPRARSFLLNTEFFYWATFSHWSLRFLWLNPSFLFSYHSCQPCMVVRSLSLSNPAPFNFPQLISCISHPAFLQKPNLHKNVTKITKQHQHWI